MNTAATTNQATYSKIALKLATNAKSCRMTEELGIMCDQFGDFLVDEAFAALVDEVEAALPFARFDSRIAAQWAQAGSDNRAEAGNEARQLGWGD